MVSVRIILAKGINEMKTYLEKMTPTEKTLLKILREKGYTSIAQLKSKVGVKAPSLYAAKNALWRKGIVRKGTVLVDFKKAGYALHILFYTETEQDLSMFLAKQKYVNTLFRIDIPKAYFFEAIFTTAQELNDFITMLESLNPTKLHFWSVSEEILKENVLVE